MANNRLIYICSPYRGEVERNLEYAKELTRLALDNGYAPIAVHMYLTQAINDDIPQEREKGLTAGKEILKNCKYILIGSKYGISDGMMGEIKLAIEAGLIELAAEKDGRLVEVYGGQQA